MMYRTHLAAAIFAVLLFLTHVSNKIIFVVIALIASILPDIDNAFSFVGRIEGTGIARFFSGHRGMFHSLSFCIIVSLLFAIFVPILALPFFLGYSLHLLADSFTIEGIKPFWPLRWNSSWKIRTGGRIEIFLFLFFVIADILFFVFRIKGLF